MAEVADLLILQQKLRLADTKSRLGNLLVNDTGKIVATETAVFWHADSGRLEAVSGLPEPAWNTPFTDWMNVFCARLYERESKNPITVRADDVTREDQSRWKEFLAGGLVWVPLRSTAGSVGGLLLSRSAAWKEEELGILGYWGLAGGHAVDALWHRTDRKPPAWKRFAERRFLVAFAVIVFLLMWMPVDLSVNAPAEVVPKNPDIVRAPIAGIIGEVHVAPNQMVAASDLILSFDDTPIRAQLDVVEQELAIANAELQRANQASVTDRRVASQLPMLKARVEQKDAQFRYNQTLLARSRIYAEGQSIAIIPDAQELEGRPVQIGEKILTLATPGLVELEFWLAVGDSIPLPVDAEVELFLNVYPDDAYQATVRYVSYQAEVSPEGILGFRGRADFEASEGLRVGWRGTARVIGEPVTLFYYIFRRPLSVLRQWTGI